MSDLVGLLGQNPISPKTRLDLAAVESSETAKDFEAVFLTQFVDQMMKTAGDTAFGSKDQAEMWRSFMSEAVAKHLVEQGGLGLAGSVQDMVSAYTKSANTLSEVAAVKGPKG